MIDILIRYLGIKTKILPFIKNAINEITKTDEAVLDLFAGSNTVAQYLMQEHPVFTNDFQKYSTIAAKTLIEYHSENTVNNISNEILFGDYYKENLRQLKRMFEIPLAEEAKLLSNIQDVYYGTEFDKFTDFFNNSPYKGNIENKHFSFNNCLQFFEEDFLKEYHINNHKKPYCLFTTYFNNPYFSLAQCIEIDSLVCSIRTLKDKSIISDEEYYIYLSFIMYSLNLIVISVGDHFAQPQKIKPVSKDLTDPRDVINLRERKKIISKKRTDVTELIKSKLNEFKQNYNPGQFNNKAFNMNALTLLKSNLISENNIKTVYIDPPYTNAHYSRFYHILETLSLYDYPDIEFFGRYRTDRYQSAFCIKKQAYNEFKRMIQICKEQNLNAVISYSNTEQCILKIHDIEDICSSIYGNNVIINNIEHMYRNFGQKPNKILAKEYLISCVCEGK